MNKKLLFFILVLISSCSHKQIVPNGSVIDSVTVKSSATEKSDKGILPKVSISGSSRINSKQKYSEKSYFLYGAEQLKLDNYYFDFPVVYNKDVKKWITYFVKRGRSFFERYSQRAGRYAPILGQILTKYGLPRDLIFLAMAESGFNNKAKSWAKAVGPWQFMPYTGKRFNLKINWYIDERRDPIKSTVAAAKYLTKLYNDFGSWEIAAAAYNAGEGKMGRAIRRYKTKNFWKISKGRYLKNETKNYVPKIMALAIIGKNLKSFGFDSIDFHKPLNFEEIIVPPMTDLYSLAKAINIDFDEIHYLNPEILRWFTPPSIKEYHLRVPVGILASIDVKAIPWKKLVATEFMIYKVRGRRTRLSDISKKFKIKPRSILSYFNNLAYNKRLKKGQKIILPFRFNHSLKDPMYADLYDRPRKSVVKRRVYRKWLRRGLKKGNKISKPSKFYVVKKGDSLWNVARNTGTSLNTLIASNYHIIKKRMIRAGDKLVVR